MSGVPVPPQRAHLAVESKEAESADQTKPFNTIEEFIGDVYPIIFVAALTVLFLLIVIIRFATRSCSSIGDSGIIQDASQGLYPSVLGENGYQIFISGSFALSENILTLFTITADSEAKMEEWRPNAAVQFQISEGAFYVNKYMYEGTLTERKTFDISSISLSGDASLTLTQIEDVMTLKIETESQSSYFSASGSVLSGNRAIALSKIIVGNASLKESGTTIKTINVANFEQKNVILDKCYRP
tara:strand:- start:398 stop:1126 length:729 start_codon:yes stop_codon:yes gene_type:complete